MSNILDQLSGAYRDAYDQHGAHAPITTQIRQLIVRFYQNEGQNRIIEMNREFARGAVKRDSSGAETAELKTFVHPKAMAAAESGKKLNPAPEAGQTEKPGKLTRHLKASLTGDQPHPLTQPQSQSGATNQNVAGDDAIETEITVDPDATGGITMIQKMTDAEISDVAKMAPAEIVSQYGEQWINEKIAAHGIDVKGKAGANKLAAILKSKVKV